MNIRRAPFPTLLALGAIMFIAGCKPDSSSVDFDHVAGATVDYFITPDRAGDLPNPLGETFDVAPSGNVVIGANGELLILETDEGNLTVEKMGSSAPDSFAFDPNGVLLTIVGQYFGQVQADGPTNAIPLPAAGMRLAPSSTPGKVLLFGGPGETANRLYALNDDGTMDFLVELPEPIVAASDSNDALYVATQSAIYRAGISTLTGQHDIELVMGLPEQAGQIRSLSAAPDDRALFFATNDRVYAVHGLAALAIVRNAGGLIRYHSEALFIWDLQRRLLVKLSIPDITDQ